MLLTEKKAEVMGALFEIIKFSGMLRACEEPETENKMRSIFYGIAVVIAFAALHSSVFLSNAQKTS